MSEQEVTWPTDVNNMYIVAWVGAYNEVNNNANGVYNSTCTLLGSTHTQAAYHDDSTEGIASTPQEKPLVKQVGNTLVPTDSSTTLHIYDLSGRSYAVGSALPHGIYIVRAVSHGVSSSFRLLR